MRYVIIRRSPGCYCSSQDDADDTAKLQDRKTMWLSILTLVLSVPALIGA